MAQVWQNKPPACPKLLLSLGTKNQLIIVSGAFQRLGKEKKHNVVVLFQETHWYFKDNLT